MGNCKARRGPGRVLQWHGQHLFILAGLSFGPLLFAQIFEQYLQHPKPLWQEIKTLTLAKSIVLTSEKRTHNEVQVLTSQQVCVSSVRAQGEEPRFRKNNLTAIHLRPNCSIFYMFFFFLQVFIAKSHAFIFRLVTQSSIQFFSHFSISVQDLSRFSVSLVIQ